MSPKHCSGPRVVTGGGWILFHCLPFLSEGLHNTDEGSWCDSHSYSTPGGQRTLWNSSWLPALHGRPTSPRAPLTAGFAWESLVVRQFGRGASFLGAPGRQRSCVTAVLEAWGGEAAGPLQGHVLGENRVRRGSTGQRGPSCDEVLLPAHVSCPALLCSGSESSHLLCLQL